MPVHLPIKSIRAWQRMFIYLFRKTLIGTESFPQPDGLHKHAGLGPPMTGNPKREDFDNDAA